MEFVTRDPDKVGAAWRFVTFPTGPDRVGTGSESAADSAQGNLVTEGPEPAVNFLWHPATALCWRAR
jgi:hypothetical protein